MALCSFTEQLPDESEIIAFLQMVFFARLMAGLYGYGAGGTTEEGKGEGGVGVEGDNDIEM